MSTDTQTFSLGGEAGADGSFQRQASSFRGWVTDDGSSEHPQVGGRYHLYAARACPWAHRTLIGRRLLGLEEAIGVSQVSPLRDRRGWEFAGGAYVDSVNGFGFLGEAYAAADPGYQARVSVPVLRPPGSSPRYPPPASTRHTIAGTWAERPACGGGRVSRARAWPPGR